MDPRRKERLREFDIECENEVRVRDAQRITRLERTVAELLARVTALEARDYQFTKGEVDGIHQGS